MLLRGPSSPFLLNSLTTPLALLQVSKKRMRVTRYDQKSALSARWVDIHLITNMYQSSDWFHFLDLFGCIDDSLEMGLLKAVPGSGGMSLLLPVLGEQNVRYQHQPKASVVCPDAAGCYGESGSIAIPLAPLSPSGSR